MNGRPTFTESHQTVFIDQQQTPVGFAARPSVTLVAPTTFNATPTVQRDLILFASSRNVTTGSLATQWQMQAQALADAADSFVMQISGATGGFGFNSWNGNNCCCFDSATTPKPDDSAYIADPTLGLIARARAAFWPIRFVYGIGDSAGAGVLIRAACEHADQIVGVWEASGAPGSTTGIASPVDLACTPSQPIHLSLAHGTSDTSAEPYTGTQAANAGMDNACNSFIDTGDTVDQMLAALGCNNQASMTTTTGFADYDSGVGGSETDLKVATGCAAGGSLQVLQMNGTGHAPSMTTNWRAGFVTWKNTHQR